MASHAFSVAEIVFSPLFGFGLSVTSDFFPCSPSMEAWTVFPANSTTAPTTVTATCYNINNNPSQMTADGAGETVAAAPDGADMDPEAWLEAQSDINTDLNFDLDLADEDEDDDDNGDPRGDWVEGSHISPAAAPAGGGK